MQPWRTAVAERWIPADMPQAAFVAAAVYGVSNLGAPTPDGRAVGITCNTDAVAEPMPASQADLDRLRQDQTGVCWWCAGVANSREHRHKASILRRMWG